MEVMNNIEQAQKIQCKNECNYTTNYLCCVDSDKHDKGLLNVGKDRHVPGKF